MFRVRAENSNSLMLITFSLLELVVASVAPVYGLYAPETITLCLLLRSNDD
jgi:hypothetical protein